MEAAPTVRVMALHALAYCERLFFLEEVEEIRVADDRVWAGRRLHVELEEEGELVELTLESEVLGIRGKMDAVRRRDGSMYPIEHKKGHCRRDAEGHPTAWESDRVQAIAYGLLLGEHLGTEIKEARIRYHADNVTVRVAIDETARRDVQAAVARSRALATSVQRPDVTTDDRRCVRCSLAPVCLPEETRFFGRTEERTPSDDAPSIVRLFSPDQERKSLHCVTHGAQVGRSGSALSVRKPGQKPVVVGTREVSDVVIHGHVQMTTQALRLCASEDIPVHFATSAGVVIGTFTNGAGGVQRRIRQYEALGKSEIAMAMARRIVQAKITMQLRHLLRATRKSDAVRDIVHTQLGAIRDGLRGAHRSPDRDTLIGYEGSAAKAYFAAMPQLIGEGIDACFRPEGRTRRPPKDRFNAMLSFGYGLLYRDVLTAVLRVGLEPSFGVLHQPRSAAYPLVLDLMELFRVPIVDMAVLGAVNRKMFDKDADFQCTKAQVWLSDTGRVKFIEVYERRKHEEYRHPVLDYSLSYGRMIELETRLLEKDWCGENGVFARLQIR